MTWLSKKSWGDSGSVFGFAVLWFPLSIVHLFKGIQSNDHFGIILDGAVFAICLIIWPWQMGRFLNKYGKTHLWIGPLILPTLVMTYGLLMKWEVMEAVVLFLAILVPILPVLLLEPPLATQPRGTTPHESLKRD